MENELLIAEAKKHVGEFTLSEASLTAGSVAAALVTEAGNLYKGICLDLSCGIGFCAEHAAVASMLLSRETVIKKIVAVNDREILPPCGRCRELMLQVDSRNSECDVLLPMGTTRKLRELLPHAWSHSRGSLAAPELGD
jgi:cytidine deaminase